MPSSDRKTVRPTKTAARPTKAATSATGAPDRRTAIADAAIAILAEEGSRGLTHRAVDRRLELPDGSTSAYFRTRNALVEAAVLRITSLDLEMKELPATLTVDQAAAGLARLIVRWLRDESRQVARAELLLEARRVPEFALAFVPARKKFLRATSQLFRAIGAEGDADQVRALTAFVEGIVFEHVLYPRTALPERDYQRMLTGFLAGVVRE